VLVCTARNNQLQTQKHATDFSHFVFLQNQKLVLTLSAAGYGRSRLSTVRYGVGQEILRKKNACLVEVLGSESAGLHKERPYFHHSHSRQPGQDQWAVSAVQRVFAG
jgi:hypothetical protein